MTISNHSSVRCNIVDGPGVKGLTDSLCPVPSGKKKGQRRVVTFTLNSFGPEAIDGTVTLEVTIRFLENREGGWTFGGSAVVLSGRGDVYEAALVRFDEHLHHKSLHVSGHFSPQYDRKGFMRVGVQPIEHIER